MCRTQRWHIVMQRSTRTLHAVQAGLAVADALDGRDRHAVQRADRRQARVYADGAHLTCSVHMIQAHETLRRTAASDTPLATSVPTDRS